MRKKCKSEIDFWKPWFTMHQLDQEKYVQKLVPVLEGHFKGLETIKEQVGDKEVLRLKASLLNSYFMDICRSYEAAIKKKEKKK
jgi:hypothetical protein